MPLTGHQVASVLLPPIRSTRGWPGAGARLRSSWTKTGSSAAGLAPAYASSALYSIESPRKPGGRAGPVGWAPTEAYIVGMPGSAGGAGRVGFGIAGWTVGTAGSPLGAAARAESLSDFFV